MRNEDKNRKLVKYLLALLTIIALVFALAIFDESINVEIFNIGIGIENYLVMIFCVLSMIKIIWEIKELD
jgi:hypothetical protein